jgi:hypothetical protein
MATKKTTSHEDDGALQVPGVVLRDDPMVYMAAIGGRLLLDHSTPSWRAEDPQKGFQRIVKDQRAKEIAGTVLDTQRTFPNAITLATKPRASKSPGANCTFREPPSSWSWMANTACGRRNTRRSRARTPASFT